MKRFRAVLVTALMLLMGMLCLVACGGAETYKFESMEFTLGDYTTVVKVGDEYGGETYDADTITLTLKSGGKAVFKSGGQEKECTWKETDGKIDVTAEEETITFTRDGEKLIMTQEKAGSTAVMKTVTVLTKAK